MGWLCATGGGRRCLVGGGALEPGGRLECAGGGPEAAPPPTEPAPETMAGTLSGRAGIGLEYRFTTWGLLTLGLAGGGAE